MFNNIKKKKFYYDKDMKKEERVLFFTDILTFISVVVSTILFFKIFFDIEIILFIVAIACILLLSYIGCKYDAVQGYE